MIIFVILDNLFYFILLMKIIICCIIIILLLYFSLQFKENYDNHIDIENIDTGIIINLDKDDISNDFNKNYDTITKYNKDFNSNFKSEILFYKFMEDSLFKIKPEDSKDITIGFYLLYPSDYGATTGRPTTTTGRPTTTTGRPTTTTGRPTTTTGQPTTTTGRPTTTTGKPTTTTGQPTTTTGQPTTTTGQPTTTTGQPTTTTGQPTTTTGQPTTTTGQQCPSSGKTKNLDVLYKDNDNDEAYVEAIGNICYNKCTNLSSETKKFIFSGKWKEPDLIVQGGELEKSITFKWYDANEYNEYNKLLPDNLDRTEGVYIAETKVDEYQKYHYIYISCNTLYYYTIQKRRPPNGDLVSLIIFESISIVQPFVDYNRVEDNVLTMGNIFNFKTLKKDNGLYRVTMNYNDEKILTLDDLELDNSDNLGWFLITFNENEIKLSFQNNPYQTDMMVNHKIPINIDNIVFNPNIKNNRYVGRIIVWNKSDLDKNNICEHYYCGKYKCYFDLSKLKSDYNECLDKEDCNEEQTKWSSLGNSDAELCIQECNKPEYRCNIKECQEMCIGCKNNEEEEWTPSMKKSVCPWYTSIKKDIKVPEPPIIRGFPGVSNDTTSNNDSTIVIEWKKPFNNMAKITNYLLEVREVLSKRPTRKLITLEHDNCDICEYIITNLKNQTTYSIELSAYNRKGLSNKSNKLIITTNGTNNEFLSNINSDISGDNEIYNEYKCVREFDNSDHMLDRVMDEDINVYNYVKSLKL
jgi:hypothetical protein